MKKHFFRLLVLGTLLLTPSCRTEIIHDIDEPEANSIMAALQQRGIDAEKIRVAQGQKATYTIKVGRSAAVDAWRVLREQNLPHPKQQGLGEVFSDVGLVPTPTQERALLRHALAGEISSTLQSLEGVLEARVQVVLPERDPLAPSDEPGPSPRASVLLRTRGPAPLDAEQIKKLVAGSVENMDPAQVEVVIAASKPAAHQAAATARTTVGPFAVAPGSQTLLRLTLMGFLLLVLALSLTLAIFVRRYRLLQRTLAFSSAGPKPAAPKNLDSSMSLMERSISRTSRTIGGGRDS